MRTATMQPARSSGTFKIGGYLPLVRLGYGAMRITGPGVWGPPRDPDEVIRVLHRAVDLGVNFIDTADSFGPHVSEELIHKALHPYPSDLVIATKAGFVRPGPNEWSPVGRPQYLRQEAEMSLRRLGVERLNLFQLHRVDPEVPLGDQLDVFVALQREGKVRHIGLSEVSVAEIRSAQVTATIATVQNRTTLATGSGRGSSTCASVRAWGSSPGPRSEPGSSPAPMVRWPAWRNRWESPLLSSPWPGSCGDRP